MDVDEDKLKEALMKKALGFESEEVLEEYVPDENGTPKLLKRKVTKKFNPPDISALKLLFEQSDLSDDAIAHMTDKQLESEMQRLLLTFKENEKSRSGKTKRHTTKSAAKGEENDENGNL